MSDKEKVAWFKALVTVWAPGFALAFMGMIGSPASKGGQLADIQFWAFASPTAIYLLILSWRVAYLSGRENG